MLPRMLVVAKAPVPGQVKTRLGAAVGMAAAAEVAAAALLDTLAVCRRAVGAERCHLSLAGHLADATRADELARELVGWSVVPQRGRDFGDRLAHAHRGVPGPVVQVGMDTPQVTEDLLLTVAAGLAEHDAVLGPAEDGGWWALALRDPARAAVLSGVPMSTPTTYADTRAALVADGCRVGTASALRDVDEVADGHLVAAQAPGSRFARAWSGVGALG
ncbi:TIGR04282 family arsenosugar biosynthesis glycosyltransferase [Nocardioides pantholopis]|uniref:TIGR04282 family arsenosugar biosynthesis glycosyltransferase n=1 Tax=Nocardioides pantholopis TaxID=2483798 RepID=UPI000FD907BC|nr:DUF2064 domain-containing protein [Nocardioides pantholopis]